jgi:hypothetical protein
MDNNKLTLALTHPVLGQMLTTNPTLLTTCVTNPIVLDSLMQAYNVLPDNTACVVETPVAPSPIVAPKPTARLTKDDYLAMAELAKNKSNKKGKPIDTSNLDLVETTYGRQVAVKLSDFVPTDLWRANDIALRSKYNATCHGRCWTFPSKDIAYTVLARFEVIKELTPELQEIVDEFNLNKDIKAVEALQKSIAERQAKK